MSVDQRSFLPLKSLRREVTWVPLRASLLCIGRADVDCPTLAHLFVLPHCDAVQPGCASIRIHCPAPLSTTRAARVITCYSGIRGLHLNHSSKTKSTTDPVAITMSSPLQGGRAGSKPPRGYATFEHGPTGEDVDERPTTTTPDASWVSQLLFSFATPLRNSARLGSSRRAISGLSSRQTNPPRRSTDAPQPTRLRLGPPLVFYEL